MPVSFPSDTNINIGISGLGAPSIFSTASGIVRFYYSDSSLPQGLSEDEKSLYRAIACKIAVNDAVINHFLAGGRLKVHTALFASVGASKNVR